MVSIKSGIACKILTLPVKSVESVKLLYILWIQYIEHCSSSLGQGRGDLPDLRAASNMAAAPAPHH